MQWYITTAHYLSTYLYLFIYLTSHTHPSGDLADVKIDVTGLETEEEEAAARILLLTLGRVLGPALAKETILTLDSNFFHVGGNSLNSILAVTSLKDHGYSVGKAHGRS